MDRPVSCTLHSDPSNRTPAVSHGLFTSLQRQRRVPSSTSNPSSFPSLSFPELQALYSLPPHILSAAFPSDPGLRSTLCQTHHTLWSYCLSTCNFPPASLGQPAPTHPNSYLPFTSFLCTFPAMDISMPTWAGCGPAEQQGCADLPTHRLRDAAIFF